MDILHLIDRLEELFNDGSALPFMKKVAIDEEKLLDLIDQLRLSIPDEIKKAQSVLNQKERILAQSQEEAARTVSLAQEQAEKLVEKDVIVQEARRVADEIIRKAKEETKLIKIEADQYAIDSLDHLEIELSKILTQVRNGIITLKESRPSNNRQDTLESIYNNEAPEPED
jgi:argininosuccinate lyase